MFRDLDFRFHVQANRQGTCQQVSQRFVIGNVSVLEIYILDFMFKHTGKAFIFANQ